jgi:hypothetical protein
MVYEVEEIPMRNGGLAVLGVLLAGLAGGQRAAGEDALVWVEGESAVKKAVVPNPGLESVDPD